MSGQVYMLVRHEGVYYGSTTTSLKTRLRKHRWMAKKYPERKVYKDVDWDKTEIVCLEICPIECLREREDFYIRACEPSKLLNINHAIDTEEDKKMRRKAYYASHREEERAYRMAHKERKAETDKARKIRLTLQTRPPPHTPAQ